MSDRTTALEFAFEKLVERLHSAGVLDAAQVANDLEGPGHWLAGETEGAQALAELAQTVRRTAEVYGKPGRTLDASDQYPSTEWELLAQLTIQFLSMKGQLDRLEFAEYLDVCSEGMRRHAAPLRLQDAVRRVSDYSRGTADYPEWLRAALSFRSLGPGADELR